MVVQWEERYPDRLHETDCYPGNEGIVFTEWLTKLG